MMTQGKRVKGFVVGSDRKGNGLVWKVRVKDPTSVHDGAKLEVVSVRPGNELRSSTDVTFRIEPVPVRGEYVLGAAGVNAGHDSVGSDLRPTREVAEGSDTFNVCATVHRGTGEVAVFCTGLETIDQARREIDTDEIEKVIGFDAIDMAPSDLPDETHTGLSVLHALSCSNGTLQALDYLLTATFRLGRKSLET